MVEFTDSELEKYNFEYSPSEHTKRYNAPDEAIQAHIKLIEKVTNRVQHECGFVVDNNVKYGNDDDELLDIYYNESTVNDAPLFVYIHGGYWQMLTKDSSAYCVEPLVRAGFRVLIVNYSLCPKIPLTGLIQQIRNCMKFIGNYGKERGVKSISFCGHSAGAHLIMSALSDKIFWKSLENKKMIKHLYLLSGVYDLSIIRHLSVVNNNNILGLNDQNTTEVSPLLNDFSHLKDFDLRFHLFVGEHDSKTFQLHSDRMYEHLKSYVTEDRCSCEILQGFDHFNIVEDLRLETFLIMKKIISSKN
ncbi:kynurenine formamidase [Culicoides brevitarsis]|uniref:kynurenine formamidase n=1 Tax=Culicoides brevitarsis TaxID=469753 RepID=UPI00307C4B63